MGSRSSTPTSEQASGTGPSADGAVNLPSEAATETRCEGGIIIITTTITRTPHAPQSHHGNRGNELNWASTLSSNQEGAVNAWVCWLVVPTGEH